MPIDKAFESEKVAKKHHVLPQHQLHSTACIVRHIVVGAVQANSRVVESSAEAKVLEPFSVDQFFYCFWWQDTLIVRLRMLADCNSILGVRGPFSCNVPYDCAVQVKNQLETEDRPQLCPGAWAHVRFSVS